MDERERQESIAGKGSAGLEAAVVRAAAAALVTFENAYPGRPYRVRISCPEFTALCPATGQPDFGCITIEYVPAARLIELKSLKLYLHSFRDVGIFHETVTNLVLEDLVRALAPRYLLVHGRYNVRGGIETVVAAHHGDPLGAPPIPRDEPSPEPGTGGA
jgi:7-cyano-7-deazaguanine reductase